MPTSPEETLIVGVGRLVDFSCRSGDLFFTAPAGPSAQEGIRAHKKLQKQRPSGSEAEYSLKVSLPKKFSEYAVTLQGRVDILHPGNDLLESPLLEEIKTSYVPPDSVPEEQKQLQWAQLKLYAYAYCLQLAEQKQSLPLALDLQAVWFDIKNKQVHRDRKTFAYEEVEAFTCDALERYCRWRRQVQQQLQQTREQARGLAFPFERYRAGQREMAVSVYRSVRDRQTLMLEAPTGIGKTVSSLYPSLKAMGENVLDKIVYLTAKNSGREAVLTAIKKMQVSDFEVSVLILRARKQTCACLNGSRERDLDGACPYTKGFYDRLPDAREALLAKKIMTPERVAETAGEYQICPFELSLQMLPWASVVVCDFNYVFDPVVGLSYFDDNPDRIALLIDEAHNLGDRSRDMYSAIANRAGAQRAAKACKPQYPLLHKAFKSSVQALARWSKTSGPGVSVKNVFTAEGERSEDLPEALARAQARIIESVSLSLESGAALPEDVSDYLREVYRYLTIDSLMAAEHRIFSTVNERRTVNESHAATDLLAATEPRTGVESDTLNEPRTANELDKTEKPITTNKQSINRSRYQEHEVKLLCLDASDYLEKTYQKFHSVILFSATLRPPEYIQARLGLPQNTQSLVLPSPFSNSQLGAFLCSTVDTRYKQRDNSVDSIIEIIHQTYRGRSGNYLVFFPSYRFMAQVAERFEQRHTDIAIVQQTPGSSEEQRALFMQAFEENRQTLGFAIMGGIFGEGIDYVGDKLIGAIVVGLGLPQINEEQELIKSSCEQHGHNGFDYAYRYPGLIRVLQAAGRVIRTEQDRGVVVLVDSRFTQSFYRRLLPSHWALKNCRKQDDLKLGLEEFWQVDNE